MDQSIPLYNHHPQEKGKKKPSFYLKNSTFSPHLDLSSSNLPTFLRFSYPEGNLEDRRKKQIFLPQRPLIWPFLFDKQGWRTTLQHLNNSTSRTPIRRLIFDLFSWKVNRFTNGWRTEAMWRAFARKNLVTRTSQSLFFIFTLVCVFYILYIFLDDSNSTLTVSLISSISHTY